MLPLACTGATIGAGMFASQRADDCPWVVGIDSCSGTAPAQFSELRDLMTALHRQQPNRNLDLVLLTVGANDVNFAGLVANVIVDAATERLLLRQWGPLLGRAEPQKALDPTLPGAFAPLRITLKPFIGGNLNRVAVCS